MHCDLVVLEKKNKKRNKKFIIVADKNKFYKIQLEHSSSIHL